MLTYKAMCKLLDGGVHAEVLDFPGVITCGKNLEEARRLLGSVDISSQSNNREVCTDTWSFVGIGFPNPFGHTSEMIADCCRSIFQN